MMKFSKLFMSASLLFLASNIYAARIDGQAECLPVAMVAQANFTKVYPPDEEKTVWGFLTDTINYEGYGWNISYAVSLPNATNPTEALEQGQTLYKDRVVLKEPSEYRDGDNLMCIYGYEDNFYIVLATTPPVTDDVNLAKAKLR